MEGCFGAHRASIRRDGLLLSETEHPPGLRTPSHAHRTICLHFVLQGLYQESEPGSSRRLEPGWVLYKPPGQRHWNRFGVTGALTLRVELDPDADPDLAGALPGAMKALRSPHLANLAVRARDELARPDGVAGVMAESLARELLAAVARTGAHGQTDARASLARRCARLLEARFQEPYRLGMAAEELGVERTSLARAFRTEHGCSVGAWIRRRRVEEVARRLREGTDRGLAELAADAGFADQSHMTRVFKAEMGLPPGAWRAHRG